MASLLNRVARTSARSTPTPRLVSRLPTALRAFHNTHRLQQQPEPTPLLPEFSLKDKIIVVSGGGRGLGLVQCEALLEAGAAAVHAVDRLPQPDSDSEFGRVAARFSASAGAGNGSGSEKKLVYHRLDVRDNAALNDAVASIADSHGRIDGLIAAAGIQQETPALEYSQEDCDRMMGVNVTGVFMTAQAVARQMVRRKHGGSLVLIGSMSGTVANRGLICPYVTASDNRLND